MMTTDTQKQKMLELNRKQKEYYESSTDPSLKSKGNIFTKI